MTKKITIVLLIVMAVTILSYEVLHKGFVVTVQQPEVVAPTKPPLFVGDIMLGRYVETLSVKAKDELYPFTQTRDFLKQHTTIGNLEGPIPDVHKPTPINGFSFSFPSSTPRILQEGGITAVSLANNHMFDKGRSGYEETKVALSAGGISHFGGYAPTTDDYFETKLGDKKVLIYGITMIATGWDESQAYEVTEKLRSEHPDAYLMAYIHWGDEYVTQNRHQRAFAHELIERGVDAIIGAHPHVVQGVEVYEGSPIFYSLGNFIFDQYWRDDLEDGYMVRVSDLEDTVRYELIPIRSSRSVPVVATESTRERILVAIAKQSDVSLVESIKKGYIDVYHK
jgi:poly-gamma-glutamate synthesis protein (capsule biosynthesis protein)